MEILKNVEGRGVKLLRPEEVANVLGVSRSSARRLMVENSIPTVTIRSGQRKKILRVEEESLERWIRAREREGRKSVLNLAS
jgi:excisionase family DNA binding protein